MNPDIRYLNGTYQTCLEILDYVLPAVVQGYGANDECAAKIYTLIGHCAGILCRKAGGDPFAVLREMPGSGNALTRSLNSGKEKDIEEVARDCLDCAAVGYGFVHKALSNNADEDRAKEYLETWGFLTCIVFSLAACALDQRKASVMSAEVVDALIKKKLFVPEWDAVVFNHRVLPERFLDKAVYVETGVPDYLSNFGKN